MFVKLIRRASLCAAVALTASASVAEAQFWNNCGCAQPVAQTCYQTVPVTQYQQVKRKVMKPVTEVKYVEQPVTEYVPVTEQKTAEIPTVRYQNVTEYKQVQRQTGYWSTNYQCINKMSPCEYDPSPTFGGWINRNMLSFRNAVTPNYVAPTSV